MKRNTAARISAILQHVTGQIDDSIRAAQVELPTEEFDLYRRKAGRIMGQIFVEILQPLYDEHRDLTPPQLRPNTSNQSGRTE